MKATLKKQLSRFDFSVLVGNALPLVNRDNGAVITGIVAEVTGKALVVECPNGKFESVTRRFRSDVGTQLGGPFRIDLAQILL